MMICTLNELKKAPDDEVIMSDEDMIDQCAKIRA